MSAAQQELQAIRACLVRMQQGQSSVAELCAGALASKALLEALPAPYTTVLQELSNRLESSALLAKKAAPLAKPICWAACSFGWTRPKASSQPRKARWPHRPSFFQPSGPSLSNVRMLSW